MFGKKADLRDEIIGMLRQDKERLELRVAELTKQVLALSNRGAFREVYREPLQTEEPPAPPIVWDPRKEVYKPVVEASKVIEAMAAKFGER